MKRSKRAGPIGSPILVAAAWLLLAAAKAAAQQSEPLYDFAPPPAWVDVAPMDYPAPEQRGVESGRILLLDRQLDVTADGDEFYQHFAVEIANTADVDEYSQLNIDVDPTYQTLVVSSVVLLFIASLVLLVLFFTKRSSAPAVYVALFWIGSVWSSAVVWWSISAGLDTETPMAAAIGSVVRNVFFAALWTLYMLNSRRVAATFVRRLRPRAEAEPEMLPAQ